jgi:tRNA nucleotidyltransferase (CCA-adding enzyme)
LLEYVVPELREGIGCVQGGEHIYDVFEHLLQALGHAAEKGWPLTIRLAALFHDIGKPRTKRPGAKKPTFYGHEVVGARMTAKIMERLKYPKDLSELVVKLVRYHMFFSDTETITLSAVRRTIVNIGREHIWELMQIRECDRVGMKKKEAPYRLRKYHAMIEEALRAPTSVGMLKINGEVMIKELGIKPGPRMGWILHALLEEALEDPDKNEIEYLKSEVLELNKLEDKKLREKGEAGRAAKEETEEEELAKIRSKHKV